MKQVLQSLKNGEVEVADVPAPQVVRGHLLVRTGVSLVSTGTERMLMEFGKANMLDKARQQPDKVRQMLDKMSTDGIFTTANAVMNKLNTKIPMGYCNVGEVLEVGEGVSGFARGDRVVSNGKHAEIVNVPANLCAKVPEGVEDESAVFTVVGAIALQGIRLINPGLGENIVVTGLGLIGLIAVQLLKANGCRVLGIDFDAGKVALARSFGVDAVDLSAGEDPLLAARSFSRGRGVDGVLIAASTASNGPIHQAAEMCRKRGRVVLVGVTGMELSREDFYKKELTFQVSCSYGPGRYDPQYEEKGIDYPIGYVRWTEQRNFEAILDILAAGKVDFSKMISHRFKIEEAEKAYESLATPNALGIVFQYPFNKESAKPVVSVTGAGSGVSAVPAAVSGTVGLIGAGNYLMQVLGPALKGSGAVLKSVSSATGVSALLAARKFGFQNATTDSEAIINADEIDTVVIATRHNSHAGLVCQSLKAGKRVFVEKPLAIKPSELAEIEAIYRKLKLDGKNPVLMAGFNRRFAPQIVKLRNLLAGIGEPKSIVITVNAGAIPKESWIQDLNIGGGRIVGEGCHFIDLLRFLIGSPILSSKSTMMGNATRDGIAGDKVTFTINFSDGSFGTVHYFANGHRSFPKERIEVFCAGRVIQVDNFLRMKGYGWPGFSTMNLWKQDKGNYACMTAFVKAVKAGDASPIPFDELVEVTRTSFDIAGLS